MEDANLPRGEIPARRLGSGPTENEFARLHAFADTLDLGPQFGLRSRQSGALRADRRRPSITRAARAHGLVGDHHYPFVLSHPLHERVHAEAPSDQKGDDSHTDSPRANMSATPTPARLRRALLTQLPVEGTLIDCGREPADHIPKFSVAHRPVHDWASMLDLSASRARKRWPVDRALGNAHDPGDFLGGHVSKVVKGSRGTLAAGKSAEGESQFRAGQVGLDPKPGAGVLQAFRQARAAGDDAAVVAAAVKRDAIEPGDRVSQLAHGVLAQVELEERILGRIPREFPVLGDKRETLHQPHGVLLHEAFEAAVRSCRRDTSVVSRLLDHGAKDEGHSHRSDPLSSMETSGG